MSQKKSHRRDPQKWYEIVNIAEDTAEICMYGMIGGDGFDDVKAPQFVSDLKAITKPKINLRINSKGGDIFDGTAISTAIREHPAEITGCIDSLAASEASVIACACDSVEMAKSSWMIIHNPMTACYGNATDMRDQAGKLDKLTDALAGEYADKSSRTLGAKAKTADEFKAAMDKETWLNPSDAIAWGLCDRLKGDGDEEEDDEDYQNLLLDDSPDAPLLIQKFRHVPDRLRRMVAMAATRRSGKTEPAKPEEAAMDPLNLIVRDGKQFVLLDGKEREVAAPQAAIDPAKQNAEQDAAIAAAVAEAKTKAVAGEREYRAMFSTILGTAGLTGEAAAKFEKDFYGRAETDLKFLADHAIGTRAIPVGEGSGEPEKSADANKQATDIQSYCTKRFAAEASLRRQFRCNSSDPKSQEYVAGLHRFVAVETKSRADWAKPARSDNDDEQPQEDLISRLLKNKSVL